jgi:hypothetical protein
VNVTVTFSFFLSNNDWGWRLSAKIFHETLKIATSKFEMAMMKTNKFLFESKHPYGDYLSLLSQFLYTNYAFL